MFPLRITKRQRRDKMCTVQEPSLNRKESLSAHPHRRQRAQSSESNGDGGDQYTGWDRFSRVVDQRWIVTSSGTALERVQYGFDRANNRLWRDNLVGDGTSANQDEFYTYDGLYRLSVLQRGQLNTGKTGITGTPAWEEDFNYDKTGNWNGSSFGYQTKVSGTTTLTQNRANTKANRASAASPPPPARPGPCPPTIRMAAPPPSPSPPRWPVLSPASMTPMAAPGQGEERGLDRGHIRV